MGIPFSELQKGQSVSPGKFPLIILSSREIYFDVQKFLHEGGTILTEADIYFSIFKKKIIKKYIKFIYPENDDKIFSHLPECDIFKKLFIAEGSLHLKNQDDIPIVHSEKFGEGKIIVFPSDFTSLMIDSRIKRKNFIAAGEKETNERISVVSKGVIKLYIQRAIENLYQHRNLPLITKWHFPDGEKNIFMFRVDSDFGLEENIKNLYNIFEKNEIPATWFIETNSIRDKIETLASFEQQEIALHCYEHKTFKDYHSSLNDMKKGLNILKHMKEEISGFAAPFGEWNEAIAAAASDAKFIYSSEFSYAYDAFPFYSFYDKKFSNVLQIPIHPVSFGRLFWGGNNDEKILNYFLKKIEEKLKLFEPLIFYTHPQEERFEILDKIFEKINLLQIKKMKFKDYAEWWKRRDRLKFTTDFINGNISINSDNFDSTVWFKISFPDGKIILSPSGNINDVKNIRIEKEYYSLNKEKLNKLKKTSLRMIWHDLLNNYRKLK